MEDRKELIEMFLKVGADLFFVNWWPTAHKEHESDNIGESPVLALYERKDRIELNTVIPAYLEGQLFKSILFRKEMKPFLNDQTKLVTDYLFFNQQTFNLGPIIHSYGNMLKELTPKPDSPKQKKIGSELPKRKPQYKALSKILVQLKSVGKTTKYGGHREWYRLLTQTLLPPIQLYDPIYNTQCPLLLNKQLRIMERLSVVDKGLEGDFREMTVKAMADGGLEPILQLCMQLSESVNTVNHEFQTDLLCILETISYLSENPDIKELLVGAKDFVKTLVMAITKIWRTHLKKNVDIKTGIVVWTMMILNELTTTASMDKDLFPFLTMCMDEVNHASRWKKMGKEDADKIQMLAISIAESMARLEPPEFFTGFMKKGSPKHQFLEFVSQAFYDNVHPDSFIVGVLGFLTDLCAEQDAKVVDTFLTLSKNPCQWIVKRLFRFNDKVNYFSVQVVCNILAGSEKQFAVMMKMRPTWINDAVRFFSSVDPNSKAQERFAVLRIVYIVVNEAKTFSNENIDVMKEHKFLRKVLCLLQKEEKHTNPFNVCEVFYWVGLLQSMNIKEFQETIKGFMMFFKPFRKQIDHFMGFDAFQECILISLID